MEPLVFQGDAFSEYYFNKVLWDEKDLAPLLDAPSAAKSYRSAMSSLEHAHRALADRQRASSTHTLVVARLVKLLGWTLGEPETVETDVGSEEAGAPLLANGGDLAARIRWLAPDAPLDLPPEGIHRRFAPVQSMVRVLEEQNLTWGLLTNGYELRLIRRAEGFIHSSLAIDLSAVAEGKQPGADCWRLMWGLLRGEAWSAKPPLIDRAVLRAKDHAEGVGKGLGQQVQRAVVALVQGILDNPANAERRDALCAKDTLHALYRQALRVLYRCLFALYAESRGLLPVDIPTYRDAYAVTTLARLATAPETDPRKLPYPGARFLEDSLRANFALLRQGADLGPEGRIPKYGGGLFDNDPADPESTDLIESLRWGENAVAEVLQQLTLVETKRGLVRVSYRELDVEQLGSIYESLLELSLDVGDEDLWLVRVDNRECVVNATQRADLAARRGEIPLPEDRHPAQPPLPPREGRGEEASDDVTPDESPDDEPGDEDSDADMDRDSEEEPEADDAPAPSAPRKPVRVLLAIPAGRAFLRPGIGRKASGSYYTNRAFVEFLVRQAADPLAEGKTPEEILALKCVDPAMGSGHFLVGATRRLSEHLLDAYRRRLEDAVRLSPDADRDELFLVADVPDEVARVWDAEDRALTACRLLVAGNCIYGVDKNPLAVDLARVSLWLATAAVDHPLSFVDHRLVCGDSLLGYDTEQLLTPPAKKRTKAETGRRTVHEARTLIAEDGVTDLWGISVTRLRERLRRALGHLQCLGELQPGDFHGQRLTYQAMVGELREFWELHELRVGLHFVEGGEVTLLDRWLAGLSGTGVTEGTRRDCAGAIEAGRRQGAFCWPLAFPDVYFESAGDSGRTAREKAIPGFDIVIGNPPWDKIKPERKQFYSQFDPTVWTVQAREVGTLVRRLHADRPELAARWAEYEGGLKAVSSFLRTSGIYVHQVTKVPGEDGKARSTGGDADLFKLFLERFHALLREGGHAGVLVPAALSTTEGASALRTMLLRHSHLRALYCFHNAGKRFFPIHADFVFAALTFARDAGGTKAFDAAFMLRDSGFLRGPQPLRMSREFVELVSPSHLSFLEVRSERERVLLERLYRTLPRLGDRRDGGWNVSFARELDMTNDSHRFRDRDWLRAHGCEQHRGEYWTSPAREWYEAQPERFAPGRRYVWREGSRPVAGLGPPPPKGATPATYETFAGFLLRDRERDVDEMPVRPSERYVPLYEGRMVHQFDHRAKAYVSGGGRSAKWRELGWDEKEIVPHYFVADDAAEGYPLRAGFCDVANAGDERTLLASYLPAGVAAGHTVPTTRGLDPRSAPLWLAIAGSFAADSVARKLTYAHLSFFVIAAVPWPTGRGTTATAGRRGSPGRGGRCLGWGETLGPRPWWGRREGAAGWPDRRSRRPRRHGRCRWGWRPRGSPRRAACGRRGPRGGSPGPGRP